MAPPLALLRPRFSFPCVVSRVYQAAARLMWESVVVHESPADTSETAASASNATQVCEPSSNEDGSPDIHLDECGSLPAEGPSSSISEDVPSPPTDGRLRAFDDGAILGDAGDSNVAGSLPLPPNAPPPTPPASTEQLVTGVHRDLYGSSSECQEAVVEDVVLRSPGDITPAARSTSLASTIEIIDQTRRVDDLKVRIQTQYQRSPQGRLRPFVCLYALVVLTALIVPRRCSCSKIA